MPALNARRGVPSGSGARADRVAQALDHALGAPGVGVGEGEQELVAADAAADVAGAQLAAR